MEGARRARAEDLPRLAELARLAIAELVPTKGGVMWHRREARPEPVDESLAFAIADPDGHLVLAGTIDEVIVGYVVARLEVLRDGGRLGVVEDVFVEPGARAVGVGEALMDAVVDWCRERDCVGIDSMVLPGNRETKNFFESFGMVARAIIVHRPLPRDAAS